MPKPDEDIQQLTTPPSLSRLQLTAAKLYGRGFKRGEIARAMVEWLAPDTDQPMEFRLSRARSRLSAWERSKQFRDTVYNHAVVKLDMGIPEVFDGIFRQARKGRVDAARLALEVTGRHNPKGDVQATQVVISLDGVPRPAAIERKISDESEESIEAEAEEVE